MKTELDRPTRPDPLAPGAAPSFDLGALASELLEESASSGSGRSAVTLISHPGLTLVLTALDAGSALAEHRAPGPVAIHCIRGRIVVGAGAGDQGGGETLGPGCTIAFPPDALHSVHAEEDSAFLIALGTTG